MHSNDPHIIRRLSAELYLNSEHERGRWETKLEGALLEVEEMMESALNDAFGDGFYRLDTLTVELTLPASELDELTDHIKQAIKRKLTAIKDSAAQADLAQSNKQQQVAADRMKEPRRMQELLSVFLKTGHFPWWAGESQLTELDDYLLSMDDDHWRAFISPLVREDTTVLKRLVFQFPESVSRALVLKSFREEIPAGRAETLLSGLSIFFLVLDLPEARKHIAVRGWHEYILTYLLLREEPENMAAGMLLGKALEDLDRLHSTCSEDTGGSTAADRWKNWIEASSDRSLLKELTETLRRDQGIGYQQNEEIPRDDNKPKASDESPYDDLHIRNSGLVLLQPFLELLFDSLGLLEGKRFASREARERAVCLLYYLATGRQEFPESRLVLPKFLCGWPSRQPVDRFGTLSEHEKDECRTVLGQVINYWEALKNTSVESLRENFLKRSGILKKEAFGWSLYVEQRPQDVLLDRLPWGTSVVKLPWMEEMLTVRWGEDNR